MNQHHDGLFLCRKPAQGMGAIADYLRCVDVQPIDAACCRMTKRGTVGCKGLEFDPYTNRPFEPQTVIRGNSEDHSPSSVTAGFRSFCLARGHTFPIGRVDGRSVY